jgi:hypothetical protein
MKETDMKTYQLMCPVSGFWIEHIGPKFLNFLNFPVPIFSHKIELAVILMVS